MYNHTKYFNDSGRRRIIVELIYLLEWELSNIVIYCFVISKKIVFYKVVIAKYLLKN